MLVQVRTSPNALDLGFVWRRARIAAAVVELIAEREGVLALEWARGSLAPQDFLTAA